MLVKRIFIFTILASLVLLFSLYAEIRITPPPDFGVHGTCLSVSFDKRDMLAADKLVITTGTKQLTVTDRDLIRDLAWDTLAATSSEDYCCAQLNDGFFELYQGDRLIRRMRYISNHSTLVYPADSTHWVLFGKEGHARLSPDVTAQIDQIVRQK